MVDERDVFETNVNTDGRKQYDWESKYLIYRWIKFTNIAF